MKFLVPTDFSKNSKHAIRYAAHLAKPLGAEVILLHAWNQIPASSELEELSVITGIEYFAERSEHSLEKTIRELENSYPVFAQPISKQGFAPDVIKSLAAEINVDLVIMGRRGMGAVGRMILGSVSSKVFTSDVRPLLVVPDKTAITELNEIVFATDFYDSDLEHLKVITKIARAFNSNITVLHLRQKGSAHELPSAFFEDYEKSIRTKLRYAGLSFEQRECSDLHEAYETYVKTNHVNLISVAGVHRSLMEQWVNPSFSKHILGHTDIPVLVFAAYDSENSDF
ncbi:MAG: universal stress protein [Salibacteraceae bacterium]